MRTEEMGQTLVGWIPEDTEPLRLNTQLNDLIADVFGARVDIVAIPVSCLDSEFFRLASGVAGDVLQQFVKYHQRVAIVGPIEEHLAASKPLADFVRESNRGQQVWFVPDRDALAQRLAA